MGYYRISASHKVSRRTFTVAALFPAFVYAVLGSKGFSNSTASRTAWRLTSNHLPIISILALCENKDILLVSSDVLVFEINRNPNTRNKTIVSEMLADAPLFVALSDTIEQRGIVLESRGSRAQPALAA